jgi:hypothetical protein
MRLSLFNQRIVFVVSKRFANRKNFTFATYSNNELFLTIRIYTIGLQIAKF